MHFQQFGNVFALSKAFKIMNKEAEATCAQLFAIEDSILSSPLLLEFSFISYFSSIKLGKTVSSVIFDREKLREQEKNC